MYFWNRVDGDNTLSLNYSLDSESLVFDIGAYEGNFTSKIYEKFNCNIFAFEPLEEYYSFLSKKFYNSKKIKLFNFGFLNHDKIVSLSKIGASSSIYNRPEGNPIGETETKVEMKEFKKFIEYNKIQKIDLIHMNIEGSEYPLLEHIIETNMIERVQHIQIQFHTFVKNHYKLRNELRKKLSRTHECNFNYPYIWESWSKIDL